MNEESLFIKYRKHLEGPWQNEPDRVEFEHKGFPCLMVRQPHSGHWCGYVGLPPGHKFYQKDYQEIEWAADAHGGLTYSNACQGDVCHTPKEGEPDDVWWLGFDCAHSGDYCPGHDLGRIGKIMANEGLENPYIEWFWRSDQDRNHYWTEEEVKREVMKLAEGLARV